MNAQPLTARAFLMAAASLAALLGGAPAPAAQGVGTAATDLSLHSPAQQQQIDAALEALAVTRGEQVAAFDELEALILGLADDYQRLISGVDAASLKHQYVLAAVDALPSARSRFAAAEASGRLLQRGLRRRLLLEALQPILVATPGVDPRFGKWMAGTLAEELSRSTSLDTVDADQILGRLNAHLDPQRSWWEFWNAELRDGRAEVDRYRSAVRAYEDAGLALNRAEYPERFGPRGETAPPGMVVVAGGSYTLGPHTGWDRPGKNEARQVTLKSFALDRTEVTQRHYVLFVNAQGVGQRRALLPRGWTLDATGRASHAPDREHHPVVFVAYEQALAYATWAGKRLPSEDEWEAAASGPDAYVYPWGNLWLSGRSNGAREAEDTLPVESFQGGRAPSGAYDMLGNVWEWTASREDGKPAGELDKGLVNVIIRGGAFSSERDKLTTRYRWAAPAQQTFASPRYVMPIGFRCAQDL